MSAVGSPESVGWPTTPAELEAEQRRVAERARRADPWAPPPGRPALVGAAFVALPTARSHRGVPAGSAWSAAVLFEHGRTLATAVVRGRATAPYVAGYLALQEGPLLEESARALPRAPDVFLVNATGADHPRRGGLALHLGAVLGLPTIGVTRRTLLATGPEPGEERGARAPVVLDGEIVAYWVRTRRGAHPVVVHGGWRVTPEAAVEVVLAVTGRVRTPEPLRRARRLARHVRATDEGRLRHRPPRSREEALGDDTPRASPPPPSSTASTDASRLGPWRDQMPLRFAEW